MASTVATHMDARCPLCARTLLTVDRQGQVRSEDVHPVPLFTNYRGIGGGYLLCDDCAVLAQLPLEVTLN